MNNQISEYLKTIGKRGGDKTKQRGADHYKAIGRAGALRRWGARKDPKNSTPQVSDTAKFKANLTRIEDDPDVRLRSTLS